MNIVALVEQQRKLLMLALPMIFSNITTPLLGLVDTAVIGHLDHAYYLGGIAVGSMIISILFWLCGFLRMSTTGVIAQALGQNDLKLAWQYFFHSLWFAMVVSLLLLLFQGPVKQLIFYVIAAGKEVTYYGQVYFDIRIFSAPAVLANFVILGYLVASRRIKWLVYQLLCINLINLGLDLLFVVQLGWGVSGAAIASVIADYCGLLLLLVVLYPMIKQQTSLALLRIEKPLLKRLLSLNRDIFIRSLALQLCLGFITVKGARLGDLYVAANAILLNLFMFASYGLDGFAYAAESLVGRAHGKNDLKQQHRVVWVAIGWCGFIGLAFSGCLWLWGQTWISWLTDIVPIQQLSVQYLPWLVLVCGGAWLSFLMDGVYIGLTRSRAMRNSMLIACLGFFTVWWLVQHWQNDGLWLAFLCFMLLRGLTLGLHYLYIYGSNKEAKN